MTLLVEFRIPIPLTLQEYHVAQLYMVAMASLQNTSGDTGIKIIKNEPFASGDGAGQYTHKVIYLNSKIPSIIAAMMPASAKRMDETAWNSFPTCRTEYHNSFLGNRFEIVLDSMHVENDAGNVDNVFNLTPEQLSERRVIFIDFASEVTDDQPPQREPRSFVSEKTGRGPLGENWLSETKPMMCCYKLARIKFSVMFLQGRVEEMIFREQRKLLTKAQKDIYCYMDGWHGMTMEDIRVLEERIKNELDSAVANLGLTAADATEKADSVKSTPF